MALALEVAGRTDVGCVRTNNEDSFDFDTGTGVFVVCDGMGGHAAGEVASGMAVRSVVDYFRTPNSEEQDDKRTDRSSAALGDAIVVANERIRKTAALIPGHAGMGSTIAAAIWNGKGGVSIAHVGDSRIYLIREHKIELLTSDHSLVMEGVRSGLMSMEAAQNSRVQNIILRALGAEDTVHPDVADLSVKPQDVLLLATDGLTRHVDDSHILELIESASTMDEACNLLIQSAKEGGGSDNVTCLLLRIVDRAD
ncbi:MAG TPA: Stp1/IreP family PP2C-type Ser/Thr phosphatase [Candidatus Saccharimonadales bacterium]|nr:Stp1/IreP family PP2C-type Ser/Thr phosphatase [Candidatus Saccharimonadales bacterium]